MDKYRKVMKPKEDVQKADEEIRVTAAGSVSAYVSRAATVFNELKKPYVIVQATGNALTKAVTAAEVIKRRFKGLHQITELKTVDITDEYEPLEEGLDKVTDVRSVSVVEIKLSKEPLDTSDKGYQPPLDESLVKEVDPEEMLRGRGRGGGGGGGGKGRGRGKGKGRGRGKGTGRGKGKGKSEEKGKGKGKSKGGSKGSKGTKGSKGKGKYEDDAPKGKGKGKKGKSKSKYDDYEEPKDRSYGKSRGKGWGKNSYEDYSKGKSSGKSSGKGKGKSKGSSYSGYY